MSKMRVLESVLRQFPRPYLTDAELEVLMKGTPDSRYGKVKRMLAQGRLKHIRRGLYCLTNELGYIIKPHPFELAQYIYGPSYISFESALSFHQLIPEAVYTVTCATSKRAKEFHTPLGIYNYVHLPEKDFYFAVDLMNENGHQFFIAQPWRAICDYVFYYKKEWDSLHPLVESLRMDLENLPRLSENQIELFEAYYQSSRIQRFLNGMR